MSSAAKTRLAVGSPKPWFGKISESFLGLGMVSVLAILFIPMPAWLLDACLSLSLSIAVVMFLFSLQIDRPLEFSSFPSVLLLTTLLRLALNVASTRRILLHGADGAQAAGAVIEAFGRFMVGGNVVVGIIIFIILVVINFVVITKGASRIAEVAARFTLDSMPGKQMAIDADLAAGLCNEETARRRRRTIEQEADFFGSMDGASKFVRGDAVAGLVIMVINIVGGLVIGTLQQHMTLMRALQAYTNLTIGDGLVAQIPALLTSIAAGLITTRAAAGEPLGQAVQNQLLSRTPTLSLAAMVLLGLAMMPGMPHIAFAGSALLIGFLANQSQKDKPAETASGKAATKPGSRAGHDAATTTVAASDPQAELANVLPLEMIEVGVGYDLLPLLGGSASGPSLLQRITGLRKQIAQDLGLIVPAVHVHDNLKLRNGEYTIGLSGAVIAQDKLRVGKMLAIYSDKLPDIAGEEVVEPTFSLPARWIDPKDKHRAEAFGATVVDATTVLTTHLGEVITSYAHELLGRKETQELLDIHGKTLGKVIEELIPTQLPMANVIKVLQLLLRERVSIRDFRSILEALADHVCESKEPEYLVEKVRQRLGKQIVKAFVQPGNQLHAMALDHSVEQLLRKMINQQNTPLHAGEVQAISNAFEQAQQKFRGVNPTPVLLVNADLRRFVLTFANRYLPGVTVLSYRELEPLIKVQTQGVIAVNPAR